MRLLKRVLGKVIDITVLLFVFLHICSFSAIAYVVSNQCGSVGSCKSSCCTGGCWGYYPSQCIPYWACEKNSNISCRRGDDDYCLDRNLGGCVLYYSGCTGSPVECDRAECSVTGQYCATDIVSCYAATGLVNEYCWTSCTCPALTSTPIPTATPRPTATLAPGLPSPTSRPDCPQSSTWFCENAGSSCPASCTTHSEYKCGNDGPCCGDCPPAVIPSDTPTPTPTLKLCPDLARGHTDYLCSLITDTGDSNSGCYNDNCYTDIHVVDRGEWLSARHL